MFISIGAWVQAQNATCGFEDINRPIDTASTNWIAQEHLIQEYLQKHTRDHLGSNISIPIVIHVISPPNEPIGSKFNPSDASIYAGVKLLNDAFNNVGAYLSPTGVDIEISFCLAKKTPENKPTNGIVRIYSDLVSDNICGGYSTNKSNDLKIKALSNWNCDDYINIWLVTDISNSSGSCSVAGYATLPSFSCFAQGVVMESHLWNSTKGGFIAAHEMGHYFGLYHTFQFGCENSDCNTSGDKVCDTPPDNSSPYSPCNTNSCHSDSPDLVDDNNNYMDYSNCKPPRFTQGQKNRMHATLQALRYDLLSSTACSSPYSFDVSLEFIDSGLECGNIVCKKVVVTNIGQATINALQFEIKLNGVFHQSF